MQALKAAGPDANIEVIKDQIVSIADAYVGLTGSTRLNEAGDRLLGNYDFWSVCSLQEEFVWTKVATFTAEPGGSGTISQLSECSSGSRGISPPSTGSGGVAHTRSDDAFVYLAMLAMSTTAVDLDAVAGLSADVPNPAESSASLYLSAATQDLATTQPVETAVLAGPPAEALLTDVKENPPGLLVMTSHGHTGFIKWALGRVTDRLIGGPVPVLVLRPEHEVGDRLKPLATLGKPR